MMKYPQQYAGACVCKVWWPYRQQQVSKADSDKNFNLGEEADDHADADADADANGSTDGREGWNSYVDCM